MKVMLSIKPEFANKIFNGTKKFEYRKNIFKNENIKTVIVYSTKPIGKIIGEFDIKAIIEEHPSIIWEMTKEYAGVTEEYFNRYFCGKDKGFAIEIKSIKKYEKPICPYKEFDSFVAPQSFKYLQNFNYLEIQDSL